MIHNVRNSIIMQEQELNFRHFHDDGADYVKLYVPCPTCWEYDILNNHRTEWFHDTKEDGTPCGGEMYIGDNGYYCCSKCLFKAPIFEWKYGCPKCNEHSTKAYLSVTRGRYICYPNILSGISTSMINIRWLRNLTKSVIEQNRNEHVVTNE